MDLNRATIIGRLTRDPELRSLSTGKSVASFSVATSRQWTDANGQKQKQSEFHNIVVWGKMAETASQYLRKGSQVYVEGRLQTRDWTAQDGTKRNRTEIVADNFIMLGSKPAGGTAPLSSGSNDTVYQPVDDSSNDDQIKVEDIPF